MKKKLIFIGNSIVAGYPWGKGKSFVSLVRQSLKGDSDVLHCPSFAKELGFDVINKGINGDTSAGILNRFEEDVVSKVPDMVLILTGTNDFIYRDADPQKAFSNLNRLAETADAAGITPVFITPLPVDAAQAECMWMAGLGVTYDAVNRDISLLSDLICESGRPYIDFNTISGYEYLDGIHPMPDGHVLLAKQTLQFLTDYYSS